MERYQDYVIKDGEFIGKFEEMYQRFDNPWKQTELESNARFGYILASLINELKLKNVIEVGCGLGKITNILYQLCTDTEISGMDISQTAIKKAKESYPNITFINGNICIPNENLGGYDGIIFSDIMWYVLPYLKDVIIPNLIKYHHNDILIIKQIFYKGQQQKYGKEYFTTQKELIDYFCELELMGTLTEDLNYNNTIETITIFNI